MRIPYSGSMDSNLARTFWRTIFCMGSIPLAAAVFASGCVRVKTEPIRVEPIYIEITINHRVQEALDDLFADLDQASQTAEYEPLETP